MRVRLQGIESADLNQRSFGSGEQFVSVRVILVQGLTDVQIASDNRIRTQRTPEPYSSYGLPEPK